MSKFGAQKDTTPIKEYTPVNKSKHIAQIGIILHPNGEFNAGITMTPGYEEKVALLLLTMVNTKMYTTLFKQLATTQPEEAKIVAEFIKEVASNLNEGPLIRPTEFPHNIPHEE